MISYSHINRLAAGVLTAAMATILTAAPAFAQTEVHVLDVGQGLSVLVESQGHAMLYDGGDRDSASYVVSYLKQEGITDLDYMIASHYDADHINGLVGALNTAKVEQMFAPDYTASSKIYKSLQAAITEKSIPKKQPAVGSTYSLGDATFQILAPSGGSYKDANNYSIAIRITDGDTSFLITGDAETDSEAEICGTGLPLESDVYVMGHHGSGTSTSWELLQNVVPEYAILSCGAGNSYGHPHVETMEKLEAMEISLFRTDTQGTIIASTDGSDITWNVEPCDDYTPGDESDQPAKPSTGTAGQTDATGIEYILNTSTKKMHYPDCRSVARMSESNKKSTTESRDTLISQGYDPCGICKP